MVLGVDERLMERGVAHHLPHKALELEAGALGMDDRIGEHNAP